MTNIQVRSLAVDAPPMALSLYSHGKILYGDKEGRIRWEEFRNERNRKKELN